MKWLWVLMLLPSVASAADDLKAVVKPGATVLQADGGRFVFGQISEFRADQYLLDTKTGRLWMVVVQTGEKGESQKLLEPVPFVVYGQDKWSLEPK